MITEFWLVMITVLVVPSQSTFSPRASEINLTGTSVLLFTICAGTSSVTALPSTYAVAESIVILISFPFLITVTHFVASSH